MRTVLLNFVARHLLGFVVAACATVSAQVNPRPTVAESTPVVTRQAIARAVSQHTAPILPQDPRTDWSRLRQFTNQEILIVAQGMAGRKGRLVSVDDTALTVVDLESSRGGTLVFPRADVSEIRQRTGPGRSRLAAVVGTAVGFAVGYMAASRVGYELCSPGCVDEHLLMGAFLVGTPIAGAHRYAS